jgi:hypothetical protein
VGESKGTLKDVQKQLRHARPDTTLETYVKDIPDSVYLMVDAMYEGIAGPNDKLILPLREGRVTVILSNCTHSEHDAEHMRAKLLKSGAPGEIRTPDLQLRSVNR